MNQNQGDTSENIQLKNIETTHKTNHKSDMEIEEGEVALPSDNKNPKDTKKVNTIYQFK